MMTVIIFSFIGGLLLVSIIFSTLAHKRQQALSINRSKINQLSRNIYDLEEVLNTLLHTDPAYDLILILHQQIIMLAEKKLALEPNNKKTQQQLAHLKSLNAKFCNKKRDNDINRVMQSDEAINVANFHLQQVANLLHKFTTNKKLSSAKFNELSKHILKLQLDIGVESHIAQADRYSDSNDNLLAQSHLKQARESLRAFSGDFPEKAELIRTLAQRIKEMNQPHDSEEEPPTIDTNTPNDNLELTTNVQETKVSAKERTKESIHSTTATESPSPTSADNDLQTPHSKP
ncbi:hypothetical protein [Alkalimarinus alittae]|uniref:Uncharacterized protein n=1 Tax=Alkalimarinus alittae TaxID=2961619 RepID=A0ABY6N6T3_9ALTE|nr:hypothetical protein [Alkalimarinus alittae]UZE97735.1 hypothetical protein NKI27_08380 [Alkalimarinus alittae]